MSFGIAWIIYRSEGNGLRKVLLFLFTMYGLELFLTGATAFLPPEILGSNYEKLGYGIILGTAVGTSISFFYMLFRFVLKNKELK